MRESPEAFGARFDDESARPLGWFAERLEANVVVGAFSQGKRLLGVGGLRASRSAASRHVAELWGFYVVPEARRGGAGLALLKRLIRCAEPTHEALRLTVFASNEAAIGIYRKVGFHTFGREPRAAKFGQRYDDELLMRLPLAPSGAKPNEREREPVEPQAIVDVEFASWPEAEGDGGEPPGNAAPGDSPP